MLTGFLLIMTIACLNTDRTLFEDFKTAIIRSFAQCSILACHDVHDLRLHHPHLQPDIVIQSILESKSTRGHSQVTKIRHAFAQAHIVVLDCQEIVDSPIPYFRSGVLGYVAAGDGPAELVQCIDAALKSQRFIGNIAALQLLKNLRPDSLP